MRSIWIIALAAALPAPFAAAHSINVDGDPSDWIGVPPAQIHDTVNPSNGEFIYRGEAVDVRTDPFPAALGPYDLTEFRVTADGTYVYFLARFDSVAVTDEVYVAIGIDLDQTLSDPNGINFMGDDSGTGLGSFDMHPEFELIVHNATPGATVVERFENGMLSWQQPPTLDDQSFISTPNACVEVRVNLVDLQLNVDPTFGLTVATFDNNDDGAGVGFADAKDTTVNYSIHDALDSMGGTPGVSGNAWARDLNDGNVGFSFNLDLGNLTGTVPVELSVFTAD